MIICSSAAASESIKINSSRSSITIGFSCVKVKSPSACLKRGGDECPLCMSTLYALGFYNIIASGVLRRGSCASVVFKSISAIAGNGIEVDEFLDDLLFTAAFHTVGNTCLQVSFHDDSFQFLQGLADGEGLTHDVEAVSVLLHHLTHPGEMTFDEGESFENFLATIF